MMDEKSLTELTAEIATQGIDEKTASRYAVLIGDTPITDRHGNIHVRDESGKTVIVLKPLKIFGE
jgi:hypothetical protein